MTATCKLPLFDRLQTHGLMDQHGASSPRPPFYADAPKKKTAYPFHSPAADRMTLADLHRSIQREIEHIVMTRCILQQATLNARVDDPILATFPTTFGNPLWSTLNRLSPTAIKQQEVLCAKTILNFEPRLQTAEVHITQNDSASANIHITILGRLKETVLPYTGKSLTTYQKQQGSHAAQVTPTTQAAQATQAKKESTTINVKLVLKTHATS